MSGFNYSNKYYYRYKYYNDNVKYSAQSYQSYNHKYCHRYDYYFLHYKYIEKNDKPFSFEKKEKVVNDTQTDVSKQIVPFRVRSSFQTRNKRPRLMITGKKITKDSGTNTNPKLFNSFDSSMSSIFGINDILSSVLEDTKKSIEKLEEKNKILPLEWTSEEKEFEYEILDRKIDNIRDLIDLGKDYVEIYKPKKKRYNLNLRVLADLVEPLEELDNMIGMNNIKESVFNKIILHLQNLDNKNTDYNHIVLCGAPGMGKTHVAKILGRVYTKMGFLSKGDFKEAKLTDLKGGYIGQTEIKTQKLLDESKGCVLFFDEAYSLGGDNKFDSYSQSAIDVINPYLDKYKNDFILIVAGYKKDLEDRFFRGNQGLRSRFGMWLEIPEYKAPELNQIFKKKIEEYGWKFVEDDIKDKFFEENKDNFRFFGRDVENLFSKCKIAHAKRVLFSTPDQKKIINIDDLKKGLEMYIKDTQSDLEERENLKRLTANMYI